MDFVDFFDHFDLLSLGVWESGSPWGIGAWAWKETVIVREHRPRRVAAHSARGALCTAQALVLVVFVNVLVLGGCLMEGTGTGEKNIKPPD